jgi:hypothetical protein
MAHMLFYSIEDLALKECVDKRKKEFVENFLAMILSTNR